MKHTASDQQWRLLKIEEDQASRGDHHLHGSKESKETVSLMVLGMTDEAILSFSFFYSFTTSIPVPVYPKRPSSILNFSSFGFQRILQHELFLGQGKKPTKISKTCPHVCPALNTCHLLPQSEFEAPTTVDNNICLIV